MRNYKDFQSILEGYLDGVDPEHRPRIGVVGIAGPVMDNVVKV